MTECLSEHIALVTHAKGIFVLVTNHCLQRTGFVLCAKIISKHLWGHSKKQISLSFSKDWANYFLNQVRDKIPN